MKGGTDRKSLVVDNISKAQWKERIHDETIDL